MDSKVDKIADMRKHTTSSLRRIEATQIQRLDADKQQREEALLRDLLGVGDEQALWRKRQRNFYKVSMTSIYAP